MPKIKAAVKKPVVIAPVSKTLIKTKTAAKANSSKSISLHAVKTDKKIAEKKEAKKEIKTHKKDKDTL